MDAVLDILLTVGVGLGTKTNKEAQRLVALDVQKSVHRLGNLTHKGTDVL